MYDQKTQTLFILGMAVSAIVGAVFGAFSSVAFSTQLFSPEAPLSKEQVDKKIVELIEEESATIAVVERVTPAVVSIVVKKERGKVTSRAQRVLLSPFFVQQAPSLSEAEAKQLVEISSGSGFFVSEDGYVLTNRHVVDEQEAQFFVVTNDGEEHPAELIDIDPFQDIAVLRVTGTGFPYAPLGDSDGIKIGQTVIAIGNTLSEFRNTVTKGVISGRNRRVTAGSAMTTDVIEQAIQTDAAINPGNSGGPLINLRGDVIGINTAVSVQGEAVAFAIPVNQAKRAIEDVREYGRIVRAWLGVRYTLVKPQGETVEVGGKTVVYELGAMIVSGSQPGQVAVIPDSPADQAGLKEGDVLLKLNGQNLTKEHTLSTIISGLRPEEKVEIEYLREGALEKTVAVLAEYEG
ncbi:trypsin-like serine protease [Candidatus Parcubacteria bacterium]|nr:trypsin-like serine protease [Candidatus Parcubacteria bacterium]